MPVTTIDDFFEPLVGRNLFTSTEERAQTIVRDYILHQVDSCRAQIAEFERKHGMKFEQFTRYTEERTALLRSGKLDGDEKRSLGQAIMADEEDWLEWKATEELLQSWLGLRREIAE